MSQLQETYSLSNIDGERLTESDLYELQYSLPKRDISPIFKLFGDYEMDDSIEGFQHNELWDETGNRIGIDESRFKFHASTNDTFLFPSASYLKVRCKIMKKLQNGNLEDLDINDGLVALQNNGWSLFSNAILKINGDTIENKKALPGLGATIMKYLRETPDEINTTGPLEYFWVDEKTDETIDGGADTSPSGTLPNSSRLTTGLKKRLEVSRGSKEFAIMLPLRKIFGLFYDHPIVYKGCKFELELTRDTTQMNTILQVPFIQSQYVDGVLDPAFKGVKIDDNLVIKITDLKWSMPFVLPNTQIRGDLLRIINRSPTNLKSFAHWSIAETVPFDFKTSRVNYSITSSGKPYYLFVIPMLKCRIDGRKYLIPGDPDALPDPIDDVYMKLRGMFENNMMFDHLRMKSAQVYLNTYQVMDSAYDINIKEERDGNGDPTRTIVDYINLYNAWLNASFEQKGSIANAITPELFRQSYPIITFDFTKLDKTKYDSYKTHEIRVVIDLDEQPLNKLDENLDDGKFVFYNVLVERKFLDLKMSATVTTGNTFA